MIPASLNTAILGSGAGLPDIQDAINYWDLSEQSGTTAADSINSIDGSVTNTAIWDNSDVGRGIKGNDTTDALNLAAGAIDFGTTSDLLSLPDTHSLVAFVYYDDALKNNGNPAHDSNSILNLNLLASGSISANNKGMKYELTPSRVVNFRIQQSITSGFGGSSFGFWSTGLTISNATPTIVIMERSTTTANAYIIDSTGETSATLSGSFGSLTNWGTNQNLIGGGSSGGSNTLFCNSRASKIGFVAIYNSFSDAARRAQLYALAMQL